MWTLLTLSTLLMIPNMARPNMEDANVAPLNSPDGGFANQTVEQIMSETWGWMASNPKSTEMGNEDCILDATGCPSSNKGFPDVPAP